MGVCTKCPHGVADSGGNIRPEFVGRTYESMPCATCKLVHGGEDATSDHKDSSGSIFADSDRSNQGRSVIQLEALQGENGTDFDAPATTHWRTERPAWWEGLVIAPEDEMTRDELRELADRNAALARGAFEMTDEFVRVWNSLDWETQCVVSYALGNDSADTLGLDALHDKLGFTSRQGVWLLLDKACRDNPAIDEIIRRRSPSWREAQEVHHAKNS